MTRPGRIVSLHDGEIDGLTAKPIKISAAGLVNVLTGSGNKTINVADVSNWTHITSKGGNDAINVGKGGSLGGIQGELEFVQYAGTSKIKLDASSEAVGHSFTVDGNVITPSNAKMIYYNGNMTATLNTGKGDDLVTVNSQVTTSLAINTGAGNDNVIAYNAKGALTIDGGSGDADRVAFGTLSKGDLAKFQLGASVTNVETVRFSDASETVGHRYAITPTGLTRDTIEKFKFSGTPIVDVVGGSGNDQIDGYLSTKASKLVLWGGAGNDILYGATTNDQLDGGTGNDTLFGGGGSDTLWGDNGNDLLNVTGDGFNTSVHGGSGSDTLRYDGGVTWDGIENYVRTATATGQVFTDGNQNGKWDTGESSLGGVQVWVDVNHNGSFDYGDLSAFTDVKGKFIIRDITAGSYTVHVLPPYGMKQTTSTGAAYTHSFQAGEIAAFPLFGVGKK